MPVYTIVLKWVCFHATKELIMIDNILYEKDEQTVSPE